MDFDDHDEPEDEEMEEMTVASTYATPAAVMGNSGRGGAAPSGGKVGGVEDAAAVEGSGNRKGSGGGGRYRECLKNHAVGIGGHAVDGCGEFIAAGEEGTLDALRCAACGCHRNFHRKEPEAGAIIEAGPASSYPPHHHHHPHHHQFSPYYRTPAGYLQHHQMAALAAAQQHQRPLALPSTSAGGGGGHSRDEGDDVSNPGMVVMGGAGFAMGVAGSGSGKKRFRTKFTPEQKDKMLGFAERVGWRIQKHDEAAVQEFCEETGVKRHVLKVWMHNNKHTLGKKP